MTCAFGCDVIDHDDEGRCHRDCARCPESEPCKTKMNEWKDCELFAGKKVG